MKPEKPPAIVEVRVAEKRRDVKRMAEALQHRLESSTHQVKVAEARLGVEQSKEFLQSHVWLAVAGAAAAGLPTDRSGVRKKRCARVSITT